MKLFLGIFAVILFTSAFAKSINRDKVCTMCVEFITKASTEILEHEDDFRQNGGKICGVITFGNDQLDAKCRELVKDKIDDVIQMVRDSKSPTEICTAVKFCPSQ
uniref:Saposin B-type domain-containing protein n=1 Tax=Panagrolaimus sp. PS1159 TaxID=55785 RepID=A0AC35FH15_9BILA